MAKAESLAGYLIALTAVWVVCAFSYASGTFFQLGMGNVGLLALDEIVVTSSAVVGLALAVVMPLSATIVWATHRVVERTGGRTITYLAICLPVFVASMFGYVYMIRRGFSSSLLYDPAIFTLPPALTSITVFMSRLDMQMSSWVGRALALAISCALVCFSSGVREGASAPDEIVHVTLTTGSTLCGSPVYFGRSGIFLINEGSDLIFVKSDAYSMIVRAKLGTGNCVRS